VAAETTPIVPQEPFWKRAVRTAYGVAYHLLWLDAAAFLYFSGVAFRDGSPTPTSTQTDMLIISGRYVQHGLKVLIDYLLVVYLIGLMSLLVSGLILHFLLGVKLFPNMPALKEWRRQREKN
jgi:hypothetical protein